MRPPFTQVRKSRAIEEASFKAPPNTPAVTTLRCGIGATSRAGEVTGDVVLLRCAALLPPSYVNLFRPYPLFHTPGPSCLTPHA